MVFALYWPAHTFQFIDYDDSQFITENQVIQRGLTTEGLWYALSQPVAGNWHPVTTLSHMLDCQLFGANPGAHHLVNALIHALNAGLLFGVLWQLTGCGWRSAIAAAVFAIHPLRVESVAWISERKDLLSGLFFLLTIWPYGRYALLRNSGGAEPKPRQKLAWYYGWALVAFALALMSKPMVVTLPFLLLLLDVWPLTRIEKNFLRLDSWWPLIREKIPFFVLAAADCIVTYSVQKEVGAMTLMTSVGFAERLGNALCSYISYLAKMFWPTDLAVFYPHPAMHYLLNDGWAVWQLVAAGVVLVLISALFVLRFPRQPWLAVGWFWFLGMLVPVIGLVQVGDQARADRYTYLPLIGPVVALVWTVFDWLAKRAAVQPGIAPVFRTIAGTASVLCIVGLALATSQQLNYWHDTVSLFEHTAAVTSDNPSAHFAIGVGLEKQGQIQRAKVEYRVALAIAPSYTKAHYNLGQLSRKESRWTEAVEHYEAALRCNPGDVNSHLNLAGSLQELGKPREAMDHFEAALRLDSNSTEALNNLAWLLATRPEPALRSGPRAVLLAERACSLSHFKVPVMIGTLAAAYAETGRFQDAIDTAEKALAAARQQGLNEVAEKNSELLKLYRAGKPCREPAESQS